MTDLTELRKKGELQEGFYYVRCVWCDEVEIRYVHNGVDDWQEIVEQVPSYEECQKLLSDQLAKIEGEEIIAELEAENEKLKTEYEKECHRADELEDSYWKSEKENTKLKELLKECESSIQYYQETYGAMDLDTYTLLAKLKEVLK